MTEAPVVRHDVVVAGTPELAFATFTRRLGEFKPPEHNLLSSPIASTTLEPRPGGHIIDRGEDGSECRWARVLAFEPPDRLVFSWDIGPTWQLEDPEHASEVELRFVADGPAHTRVDWNIVTSTDTARDGPLYTRAWTASRAGRFTWPATPPCWTRHDQRLGRDRASSQRGVRVRNRSNQVPPVAAGSRERIPG